MENQDIIKAVIEEKKGESGSQNQNSETDWSIIEESESKGNEELNNATSSGESMFSFGNISQTVIVTTINNKLSDITTKMDLILNKLETLEKKVDSLELQYSTANRLNNDFESSLIFNNEDIRNILNLDNYPVNDQSENPFLQNDLSETSGSTISQTQQQFIPTSLSTPTPPYSNNFYSSLINNDANRFTNRTFSPNLFRVNSNPSLNSTFTPSMFNATNYLSRNNTTTLNTNSFQNGHTENNTNQNN